MKVVIQTNKPSKRSQIIAQTPDEDRADEIAKEFARKSGTFVKDRTTGDYSTSKDTFGVFDKDDLR